MLLSLQNEINDLTTAEKRVGQLVIKGPREFCHASLASIAARAHVNKPTVVRFCKSLGHEGLIDFKKWLSDALTLEATYLYSTIDSRDGAAAIIAKVSDALTKPLLALGKGALPEAIESVSKIICKCLLNGQPLTIADDGTNHYLTSYIDQKISDLGFETRLFDQTPLDADDDANLGQNNCLLLISEKGLDPALLKSCIAAKRRGFKTVAIAPAGSPLAQAVHEFLNQLPAAMDEAQPITTPRVISFAIIDILIVRVALLLNES
jgi:RpiR family transcriptional regulator, carbohydrate utilization regulator